MRPTLTPVPTESPGTSPGTHLNAVGQLTLANGLTPPPGIGKWGGHKGLVPGLGYTDYHQDPALRHSLLNRMSVSPLYLKTSLEEGDESTTDMTLGRVFHTITLQPELEAATVVVVDASTRATNKYKDAVLANPGLDIVMKDEFDTLCRMRDRFHAKAINRDQLGGAFLEASVFWADAATGVNCKARPDIMAKGVLCDLKTTRDIRWFAADAEKYGYHRQAAFYLAGAEAVTGETFDTFRFIAVEKSGAFDSKIFELSKKQLAVARQQNAANLAEYKRCLAADVWPGYPEIIEELS